MARRMDKAFKIALTDGDFKGVTKPDLCSDDEGDRMPRKKKGGIV